MVDGPGLAPLVDAEAVVAMRSGLLPACVCGDGGRDMTANAM